MHPIIGTPHRCAGPHAAHGHHANRTFCTLPRMVPFTDPTREQAFAQWLARIGPAHGLLPDSVASASSDASFRRYLRIATQGGGSFVIMDAPPDKEDCRPFVHVAQLLAQGGLTAPRVIEANLADGFLLLSDLGDTVYLAALQAARDADMPRCDALYRDAIGALLRLQALADAHAPHGLPPYDRTRLAGEMALFEQWYVTQHLQATLSDAERAGLQRCTELIVQSNLAQAQVLVHRDYHSRNLMVQASGNPGILDFQDAVIGPITYDLVSLLRDAYIEWPEDQQLDWAIRYWQGARAAGLPVPAQVDDFYRDFEWMGLQRHLKVLGIFARLCHRDGKRGYLDDIPLVATYALRVAERYVTLAPLAALLRRLHGEERKLFVF